MGCATAGMVTWTFSSFTDTTVGNAAAPNPYRADTIDTTYFQNISGSGKPSSETATAAGTVSLKVAADGAGSSSSRSLEFSASSRSDFKTLADANLVIRLRPTSTTASTLSAIQIDYDVKSAVNSLSVKWELVQQAGTTDTAPTFAGAANQTVVATVDGVFHNNSLTFTGLSFSTANDIWLRASFSGPNGSASGIIDLDNISISAVPEPTNLALGLFGVGVVSVAAGRKLLQRTVG